MFNLIPNILSGILLHMLSKFVTEKFFSSLVETLVVKALEYLQTKDLLKNTQLDEELITLVLGTVKDK